MHSVNHWGGSFEVNADSVGDNDGSQTAELDPAALSLRLNEVQQSWLLEPQDRSKKKKYVDFGCIVCSHKALKWTIGSLVVAFMVVGLPAIVTHTLPKKTHPPEADNYSIALAAALKFFEAQKSGVLPKSNNVSWRGNSGLKDGLPNVKLVGGYYDAGDNIKFNFPMAFSMTMLSWSVIEYSEKYKAMDKYDDVRELIKWGTEYLLLTFNSSASKIDHIYSQVGGSQIGSKKPDDHNCWQRPEDMDYDRPVQTTVAGPDLAGEMVAALASASLVFQDDDKYHTKLVKGAKALFDFSRDPGKQVPYSRGNSYIEPFYNSTNYFDEYIWSAAWMYYATGNKTYLTNATDPEIANKANAFSRRQLDLRVLSWDNKWPAVELLLTRFRIFLSPGYPSEDMLRRYHNATDLNMCSYLRDFNVFNWTEGGMIELNHGNPQSLQYVANAAFLASLFVDYMKAVHVSGWPCGPYHFPTDKLHQFATSQINYILGENPLNLSYLVGYRKKYPLQVHHRGASIQSGRHVSCTFGKQWLEKNEPNPNLIVGAMVGGPDKFDRFHDKRKEYKYTEPTLAGNAGLVAALVSLTNNAGVTGIDRNSMFSQLPPLYPNTPPPPPPWIP